MPLATHDEWHELILEFQPNRDPLMYMVQSACKLLLLQAYSSTLPPHQDWMLIGGSPHLDHFSGQTGGYLWINSQSIRLQLHSRNTTFTKYLDIIGTLEWSRGSSTHFLHLNENEYLRKRWQFCPPFCWCSLLTWAVCNFFNAARTQNLFISLESSRPKQSGICPSFGQHCTLSSGLVNNFSRSNKNLLFTA